MATPPRMLPIATPRSPWRRRWRRWRSQAGWWRSTTTAARPGPRPARAGWPARRGCWSAAPRAPRPPPPPRPRPVPAGAARGLLNMTDQRPGSWGPGDGMVSKLTVATAGLVSARRRWFRPRRRRTARPPLAHVDGVSQVVAAGSAAGVATSRTGRSTAPSHSAAGGRSVRDSGLHDAQLFASPSVAHSGAPLASVTNSEAILGSFNCVAQLRRDFAGQQVSKAGESTNCMPKEVGCGDPPRRGGQSGLAATWSRHPPSDLAASCPRPAPS